MAEVIVSGVQEECMPQRLAKAIAQWRRVIGRSRVLDAEAASAEYGACTTGIRRKISGAILIRSRDEVVAAMKISRKYKVPLYPIGTGHNWGLGSAVPVMDGCVIVDLSRMRRIVAWDGKLGIVTIEPGVTQQQLYDFLVERKSSFMVSINGAGPNNSIIGNALEHGVGEARDCDHLLAVTSVEAVLPDGEVFRSSLSAMGGKEVDRAYKWNAGPYLDGIFAQGAFGIVTEASFILQKRPKHMQWFSVYFKDKEDFGRAISLMRELSMSELVYGPLSLRDTLLSVLPDIAASPGGKGPGETLSQEYIDGMAEKLGNPAWIIRGLLSGEHPDILAVRRKMVQRLIKPFLRPGGSTLFFTPARLARLKKHLPREHYRSLENYSSQLGRPLQLPIGVLYWKHGKARKGRAPNPAKDGMGLLVYACLVPLDPARASAYLKLVRRLCGRFGLDHFPEILVVPPHRCLYTLVFLFIDPQDPREVARAHGCYEALFKMGRKQGFVPFRLSTNGMRTVIEPDKPFWKLVTAFKRAIDPDNLLAPGRYAPV